MYMSHMKFTNLREGLFFEEMYMVFIGNIEF